MSPTPAIQLQNLSKQFGRRSKKFFAVKNLNLTVEAGQVYGFLGPNGAGKSTTIRMMMDLIHPTTGQVRLFDRPVKKEREVLGRAGALVEGAAFYDFLTGRQNLRTLAQTSGCYDAERAESLLAQLNLAEQADRRVKGYSTGMKQRLGLAAALLTDPDLVILDEPTNGLDPAGIQEMRRFIRDLVDRQEKTVFLSSHLLGEVEQICDRVAIINQGEIVREGNVRHLLDQKGELVLEVEPLHAAIEALKERWQTTPNGNELLVTAGREETPQIAESLINAGVSLYQIQNRRQTLEQFFLSVIADQQQTDHHHD